MSKNSQLEARVRQRPGMSIIDLRGEIDGTAEAMLSAAYDRAIAQEAPVILLNFHNVGYMNSSGIALIVKLLIQAQRSGRRLAACGLSDHFADIFQITRLSDYISIRSKECAEATAGSLEPGDALFTG
jgi:anti-anti-sigma factor